MLKSRGDKGQSCRVPERKAKGTVKGHDGATPISAAGTAISCPETVPGAEATALCQAISVTGTVDGTAAGAGSQILPCLPVPFRL